MRDDLTAFSFQVLVLIGNSGAGPHDLVRMARRGSAYARAAESQYYAEPKRLERLGLVTSRKEPGRTGTRTHYMLTDAGRAALRAWMDEPTPAPRVGSEAITRLLAADLVGEAPVLASLRAMRPEIRELLAGLEAGEALAPTLPSRERYLLLNHRLARRVLEVHLEWLDDVERELRNAPDRADGATGG